MHNIIEPNLYLDVIHFLHFIIYLSHYKIPVLLSTLNVIIYMRELYTKSIFKSLVQNDVQNLYVLS